MHKDLKPLALMLGLAVLVLLTGLVQPQLRVLATDALGVFSAAGSFNNTSSTFAGKGTINSCNPETMSQAEQGGTGVNFPAYGLAGCTDVPSSSTNHEGGGVFGAVNNASIDTNAVGGAFYCAVTGNGTDGNSDLHRVRCWAINPLVSDHGFNHTLLINTEEDYNVSGDDTKVVGHFSAGASTHQLAAGSVWMLAGPVGNGIPWPIAYGCADGASSVCFQSGVSSPTANNSPSQPFRFLGRNVNGAITYTDIGQKAGGDFYVNMNVTGGAVHFQHQGIDAAAITNDGGFIYGALALASLGSMPNFTVKGCTDCTPGSNPCVSGGTGAVAKRLNGAWDCR